MSGLERSGACTQFTTELFPYSNTNTGKKTIADKRGITQEINAMKQMRLQFPVQSPDEAA